MAKKTQLKNNICLGNISIKGEGGIAYVKDQLYTDEEVRRAPKGKKYKFTKFDATIPGLDKGTEPELRALIQRLQIKIETLEAALTEYEGAKPIPAQPQGAAITSKTGGQQPAKKL